ncbi:FHA domain containing protein [Segniliparus rotundus DSM 44985]|uniref:FHA domain containing protein n=1 Tax=Segniliparus rotundus (strain ATCC BAA-972 / CDC 1076 / CIP 108378 / DSM 44985 / JCM 13578) TaxID=640132 RepID=D6ZBA4_SEGRD|nr:FHA domain-containing protein [Segniliparus rotundus]ADG96863.1 FHA domain containing protein [Segniliparus rotundus DSM 44985]
MQQQALIWQAGRAAFLALLWLFVFAVVRVIRSDIANASGSRVPAQSKSPSSGFFANFGRGRQAKYLVVTRGALRNTRIALGDAPVLIGRADDSTLVVTDEYASSRHARLLKRGEDWFVEDLGSTNGTYLDRVKVTAAVRVPLGSPIQVGKTVVELRA